MSEVIVRYSDNGYGNVSGEIVGDIVRCKECRYYIDNIPEDSTDDECRWRSEEQPNADDFCSYGERREP